MFDPLGPVVRAYVLRVSLEAVKPLGVSVSLMRQPAKYVNVLLTAQAKLYLTKTRKDCPLLTRISSASTAMTRGLLVALAAVPLWQCRLGILALSCRP